MSEEVGVRAHQYERLSLQPLTWSGPCHHPCVGIGHLQGQHPVAGVVHRLDALRIGRADFETIEQVILVLPLDGQPMGVPVSPDAMTCLPDGSVERPLAEVVKSVCIQLQPGISEPAIISGEETTFVFRFGDPGSSKPFMTCNGEPVCVDIELPDEDEIVRRLPILGGEVSGTVVVHANDVALTHGSFDVINYATGTAVIGDTNVEVLFIETKNGDRRAAVTSQPLKDRKKRKSPRRPPKVPLRHR
jgi:hypothetical protein